MDKLPMLGLGEPPAAELSRYATGERYMQSEARVAVRLTLTAFAAMIGFGLCSASLADPPRAETTYYSALDLEADCSSSSIDRKDKCGALMTGVLGTFVYLSNSDHMSGTICLPDLSAEILRVHFLSFAADHRKEIQHMLAGAAVADMLYDKYPCPKEAKRRADMAAKAGAALLEHTPNGKQ